MEFGSIIVPQVSLSPAIFFPARVTRVEDDIENLLQGFAGRRSR